MDVNLRYPLQPPPRLVTLIDGGPWHPGDAETAILSARLLHKILPDHWIPMFPVVVLTGPRHGFLTEQQRDLIWRRWGVPVYEFLTDSAGAVVASECDAHEGLHVHGSGVEAKERECGCGVVGPMISLGAATEATAAA
jgi:hypothetical protein